MNGKNMFLESLKCKTGLKYMTIGEFILVAMAVGLIALTGYAIYDSIVNPSNTGHDVQYFPIILPIP